MEVLDDRRTTYQEWRQVDRTSQSPQRNGDVNCRKAKDESHVAKRDDDPQIA